MGKSPTVLGYAYPVISIGWRSKKFNAAYVGPSINALEVFQAVLTITWYPAMTIYLKPHAEFYSAIDSGIRDAINEPTIFVGALTVGFEM